MPHTRSKMADDGNSLNEEVARAVERLMETFPEHGLVRVKKAISHAQIDIGEVETYNDSLIEHAAMILLEQDTTIDDVSLPESKESDYLDESQKKSLPPLVNQVSNQLDSFVSDKDKSNCTNVITDKYSKQSNETSHSLNDAELLISPKNISLASIESTSSDKYVENSSPYESRLVYDDELQLDDDDNFSLNCVSFSNIEEQDKIKSSCGKNKSSKKHPAKNSKKKKGSLKQTTSTSHVVNDSKEDSDSSSSLEDIPVLQTIAHKYSEVTFNKTSNNNPIHMNYLRSPCKQSISSTCQPSTSKASSFGIPSTINGILRTNENTPKNINNVTSNNSKNINDCHQESAVDSFCPEDSSFYSLDTSKKVNSPASSPLVDDITESHSLNLSNSRLDLDDIDEIKVIGTSQQIRQRAIVTIMTDSACQTTCQDSKISAVLTLGETSTVQSSSGMQQKRKLTSQQLLNVLSSLESKLMMADLNHQGPSTSSSTTSHLAEEEPISNSSAATKRTLTGDLNPTPIKRPRMSTQSVDSKSYRDSSTNKNNCEETFNDISNESNLGMTCEVCDSIVSLSKCCQCNDAHVICLSCLEEEVRNVMNTDEKMYMTCSVKDCGSVISIDSLESVLPSLVIDLLRENKRRKELQASNKAIKRMKGMVTCPSCSFTMLMDDGEICFKCAGYNCKVICCRFCKAPWKNNQISFEEHKFCVMLSYVGKECLRDITILPDNWSSNNTVVKDGLFVRTDDPPNAMSQSLHFQYLKDFVKFPINLTSLEGAAIANNFHKETKRRVKQLWRIQNKKLWERYVLKRMHIEEELSAQNLNERYLYHGTISKNIDKICREGFDMRVPVLNGKAFGNGIYFSPQAAYSLQFAKGCQEMFMARVICGLAAQGGPNLTRPPTNQNNGRIFDSCVDNLAFPNMYVIFDNCQVYPEVLIEF